MKMIKWIGHPVIFICVYLLFITEGQNFGGFYLLYLLLGLPHGAFYAILATIGMITIIIGFNIDTVKVSKIQPLLYLIGLFLMIWSLFNFFATGDQTATFRWAVPTTTFVLVCISGLCFFIYTLFLFHRPLPKRVEMV